MVRYLWWVGNISGTCDPNEVSPVTSAGLLCHISRATESEVVLLLDIGKRAATFYLLTMTTNALSSGELIKSIHSPSSVTLHGLSSFIGLSYLDYKSR